MKPEINDKVYPNSRGTTEGKNLINFKIMVYLIIFTFKRFFIPEKVLKIS